MRQHPEGIDRGLARKLFPQHAQNLNLNLSNLKNQFSNKSSIPSYNPKTSDREKQSNQSQSEGVLNAGFIGIDKLLAYS